MKNPISTSIQNWQNNITAKILSGPAFLLAFFFVSCEEPIEVESDLVPGGNNTEIRYVEIPLSMTHTSYDSLLVSSVSAAGSRQQVFVGHQNSPEVGNFSAQAYFGAILDPETIRDSVTIGSEVIETKLYLGLNYFYGNDFDNSQKFKLYRLQDTLQITGKNYTVSDELSAGAVISNDETTFINPQDTIADFLTLNNVFGQNLLDLAQDQTLGLQDIYNFIRGFKLEVEPGQNNLQALSLGNQGGYIEVVYQSPTADTLQNVRFNLAGSGFTHVDYQPGSLIPDSYNQQKSFDLTDPTKAYFNNFLGISPRLNLDGYLSFIDTVEYIQINRGEITIENANLDVINTPSEQIRPARNLVPYILTENGNFSKVGEDFWAIQSNFNSNGAIANPSGGTSPTNITYDENKKSIRGDISFFLQEIYTNPSFWEEENSLTFTRQYIQRNPTPFNETPTINIGDFDNFLVDKENIKLKIYYTTFK